MPAKFFGQFLLERNKIIKEELLDALSLQKDINVKVGTIALDAGYLNAKQIESIHKEQLSTDKMFCEIAVDMKLLTKEQTEELLQIQKNEYISLGEALLQKGYLTLSDLEVELLEYKKDKEYHTRAATEVLQQLSDPKLAGVFLEITIKFLRRLGDIECHVAASSRDKDNVAPNIWKVFQEFYGDVNGTYIISLADESLLQIASNFSQEKLREIDDLAKDSLKEFVNILVGNTVTKLTKDNISLTIRPPKIVTSLSEIDTPEGETETIAVSLASDSGEMQMALIYESKK